MTIRPFRPTDHDAANALHRSVWWPERSPGGWRWLDANPARQDIDAPSGWVIEDKAGEPAAFVGNFIQRFWVADTAHYGATGFSIIVPRAVRGASRSLIQTFIDQPNTFAKYTLNANSRSAPLYSRHGMAAWPPRTHDVKLSWIIDPVACLHGRILRKLTARFPALTDPYRERFLNKRLGSTSARHVPDTLKARGVRVLTDLGDASPYAAFWTALKAEGRLIADRSPAMLRWRLADPDQTIAPTLLAHVRKGLVTGYAMAIMAKANPIEPAFLEIIDLIALQDEPDAIPALVEGLIASARAQGAAKVRLQALGEDMLRRLGPHAASARREGGWGHGHAIFSPDAPPIEAWSPTPFDGDHGICQRAVPLHAAERRRQTPLARPSRTSKAGAARRP